MKLFTMLCSKFLVLSSYFPKEQLLWTTVLFPQQDLAIMALNASLLEEKQDIIMKSVSRVAI